MQGKAAYKAGMFNAAGTLLSGGGQAYTTRAQGKALGLV